MWKRRPDAGRDFEEKDFCFPTVDRFVASVTQGDKVCRIMRTALAAVLDVMELEAILTANPTQLALVIVAV